MARRRVVVAGMGDTGLLTAIHLSPHVDVVGISTKPGLVSGQELGLRITKPERWARDYLVAFERYRRLDGATAIHGALEALDVADKAVRVRTIDGTVDWVPFDALVIATGVRNGFWRQPSLVTTDQVAASLMGTHTELRGAESVAVVGGGAAAVSSAFNLAVTWPDKQIDLYYPGTCALGAHHPRVWEYIATRLAEAGVGLHPGHRAIVPEGFGGDRLTTDPVEWSTGQPTTQSGVVLWAIGRVTPNTDWLPGELLDEHGFVRVGSDLRVQGLESVYAVGDVAATDALRTSARNRADRLVAHNVLADLAGGRPRTYRPRARRWGSVLGPQVDGLLVFSPTGRRFRFPGWSLDVALQPWIVRRGIYRGMRPGSPRQALPLDASSEGAEAARRHG